MELFHEMYGCYYHVVGQILREAHGAGLSRDEIDRIVAQEAFSESGLHLLPRLFSGEWDFLQEKNGTYRSKLQSSDTSLPLTFLERSWLKALLCDRRIRLFWDEKQITELHVQLQDIAPLFHAGDFHIFDSAGDGDPYEDENYIRQFRRALSAIKENRPLFVEYERAKGRYTQFLFLPQQMLYSTKDDKFRIVGKRLHSQNSKAIILNLARIREVSLIQNDNPAAPPKQSSRIEKHRVKIAIYKERNALERCMLQFASYDKQTVYDEEKGCHVCEISYDIMEETELLIRILSFGPVVEVLGPERMRKQIRQRIAHQMIHMK